MTQANTNHGSEAMNFPEFETAVVDRLTPEALEYWNGMPHDDIFIEYQRHGLDAVVDLIEDLAKPIDG